MFFLGHVYWAKRKADNLSRSLGSLSEMVKVWELNIVQGLSWHNRYIEDVNCHFVEIGEVFLFALFQTRVSASLSFNFFFLMHKKWFLFPCNQAGVAQKHGAMMSAKFRASRKCSQLFFEMSCNAPLSVPWLCQSLLLSFSKRQSDNSPLKALFTNNSFSLWSLYPVPWRDSCVLHP